MSELFNNFLKLLVVVVAACVAIRLAYDAVRPALSVIGILIVIVVVVRLIGWSRDRW